MYLCVVTTFHMAQSSQGELIMRCSPVDQCSLSLCTTVNCTWKPRGGSSGGRCAAHSLRPRETSATESAKIKGVLQIEGGR